LTYILCRTQWEQVQIRFGRSARRHRIGKAHALHVMANVEPLVHTNARGERQYEWQGLDDRGDELEIVGVMLADETTLFIFHVMPTRFRRGRQK
jgi:hypothetical protein